MTQEELYTVENVEKIDGDGFYIQVIKTTNNRTQAVIYSAVTHDDSGDVMPLFTIYKCVELAPVIAWANDQI